MTSSSDEDEDDVIEEIDGDDDDDNDANDDDDDEDAGNQSTSEVDRLQSECSAMVQLLVNLEKEEHKLHCQLEILAREALLCGFSPDVVEPAAPKRRRTTGPAKKKEENS